MIKPHKSTTSGNAKKEGVKKPNHKPAKGTPKKVRPEAENDGPPTKAKKRSK